LFKKTKSLQNSIIIQFQEQGTAAVAMTYIHKSKGLKRETNSHKEKDNEERLNKYHFI
jgi:hypothetical protein